jgi:hypothetical protein
MQNRRIRHRPPPTSPGLSRPHKQGTTQTWTYRAGEDDSDPARDKANHTLAVSVATTDPIYQSSLEIDSEGGGEVYTVGNREELLDKMVEEIKWEVDKEIAHAAGLARETERGKRHNSQQDDSGASKDQPRDGTLARRHHLKFNSRCPTD